MISITEKEKVVWMVDDNAELHSVYVVRGAPGTYFGSIRMIVSDRPPTVRNAVGSLRRVDCSELFYTPIEAIDAFLKSAAPVYMERLRDLEESLLGVERAGIANVLKTAEELYRSFETPEDAYEDLSQFTELVERIGNTWKSTTTKLSGLYLYRGLRDNIEVLKKKREELLDATESVDTGR